MLYATQKRLALATTMFIPLVRDPDPVSQQMADSGHPLAAEYLSMLTFWRALPYLATPSSRYVSFIDFEESSRFSLPRLTLTTQPRCLPGFTAVHRSDTPLMSAYIDAAAAAGWPADLEPRIGGAAWHISTRSPALSASVQAVLAELGYPDATTLSWTSNDHGPAYLIIKVDGEAVTPATTTSLYGVLKHHHKGHVCLVKWQHALTAAA